MSLFAMQDDPTSGREPGEGDHIGGYQLVRLLGRGTSGRVFEVEHEKLGRRAAMKILLPEHGHAPVGARRLLTEALAVNRINHPNIVEITDILERSRGAEVDALVMELLEGESLADAMAVERPMQPERFLPILAQVCAALAAAHAAGFAHRDLKPDNIFLVSRNGRLDFVKLLDFGLAKRLRAQKDSSGVRAVEGAFLGTPAYVSPEQAAGRAVDHRTDLYAVGVVLYELAAGRLPFEGKSIGDYLLKHLSDPPPHLPAALRTTRLGCVLDAVAQRCMQKDPDARFISAGQMAAIFEGLAHGEPVEFTQMDHYIEPAPPGPRRPPHLGYLAGAAVLAALAGLYFASPRPKTPPVPKPPAAAAPDIGDGHRAASTAGQPGTGTGGVAPQPGSSARGENVSSRKRPRAAAVSARDLSTTIDPFR